MNQHNRDQGPHNQHETFHSVSPFLYSLGLRANPTRFETVTYGIATGLSATAITKRAINEEFEPAIYWGAISYDAWNELASPTGQSDNSPCIPG
jgi:hypothetical protein